jgi:hypothetical protein
MPGLRELAPSLRAAALNVATNAIPKKARNPLAIKLYMDDLRSAANRLANVRDMPEADLRSAAAAFPPLAKTLMEEAGVPRDDDRPYGPHGGIVSPLQRADGGEEGYVELKLHDDKGDLEAWLTRRDLTAPFDIRLDAVLVVSFPDKGTRRVELRIRNADRNEDEDGAPNIREGRTNYFIYPGDTGADASWLKGKDFQAGAVVTFEVGDRSYAAQPFDLVPHMQ